MYTEGFHRKTEQFSYTEGFHRWTEQFSYTERLHHLGCDWGMPVHLGLYPVYFSIRTYEFLGHITYMYMYVGMAAKIGTFNWEYLRGYLFHSSL